MSIDRIVEGLGGDPNYVRYLLIEWPYIRSAMDARGVTLDEEARVNQHSSSIGNALHLDVIELEMWLATLTKGDLKLILEYVTNGGRRPPYSKKKLGRIKALRQDLSERLAADA